MPTQDYTSSTVQVGSSSINNNVVSTGNIGNNKNVQGLVDKCRNRNAGVCLDSGSL